MNIIPAIDLLEGKAVRLREGDRAQRTVFSDQPWTLVHEFAAQGATRVHIVDLDGAFSGARAHRDIVRRIAAESAVPVQVGGGIRDRAALDAVFETGARYAVLGTAAVKNPAFAEQACRAFADRIIIAVDARDGIVAVEGWVEAAQVTASELARRAADWGAAAVLYTDVARDGTHAGPNVDATARLHAEVGDRTDVIASGGVSSLDDIRALAAAGIPHAIVGRALYDNHFSLKDAIAAAG